MPACNSLLGYITTHINYTCNFYVCSQKAIVGLTSALAILLNYGSVVGSLSDND